jgi:Fe-S-cluster containining protein
MNLEIIAPSTPQTECRRCGNCCTKGSPTLHVSDAQIIKSGVLKYSQLYTIREGEMVFNNIDNKLVNIDYELIKVREKEGTRTCIFFNSEGNECAIYDNRPAQCKAFECWNTTKLIEAFTEEKLTREHLLEGSKSLLSIVYNHDERCNYLELTELFDSIKEGEDHTADVLEIFRYDTSIRPIISEKLGIASDFMSLLLGRPLTETSIMFGYKVESQEDGSYCLVNV